MLMFHLVRRYFLHPIHFAGHLCISHSPQSVPRHLLLHRTCSLFRDGLLFYRKRLIRLIPSLNGEISGLRNGFSNISFLSNTRFLIGKPLNPFACTLLIGRLNLVDKSKLVGSDCATPRHRILAARYRPRYPLSFVAIVMLLEGSSLVSNLAINMEVLALLDFLKLC